MPGDAIIGRVAVKVIPDTKLFKQKLEKELDAIEARLERREVEFHAKINEGQVAAEAAKAKAIAEQTLGDVTLKVNLDDQTSLRRNLSQLESQLARLRETTEIKVNYKDPDDVAAKIAELQEHLRLEIRVDESDPSSIKRALNKVNSEIQRVTESNIEPIRLTLDEETLKAERDRLQKLSDHMDAIEMNLKFDSERARRQAKEAIAGLQEDLRVEIRVDEADPDSIKRALNKIDSEIQRAVEEKLKPIKLSMDEDSLRAERNRLQKLSDHMEAIKLNAKFDADRAARHLQEQINANEFRAKMAVSRKALDDIQRELDGLRMRPGLDPEFRSKMRRDIQRELLRLHDLKIRLQAELDPLARRKIEAEIEMIQARVRDLKFELQPMVDPARWLRTRSSLNRLARDRTVVYRPVLLQSAARGFMDAINRLSGRRLGQQELLRLTEYLSNLDLALPRLSTISTVVAGLSAWLTNLSANFFGLAQELGSIAYIGLTLPGVLVSIGVAAATFYMAFKDFKEVLPDVVDLYGTLQGMISNTFWKRAEAPLRRMAKELFPEIQRGFRNVADATGEFTGKFSDSVRRILGGEIEGMFAHVASGFRNLATHTDAFARITGVLGRIGSEYFERMLVALGRGAEKWADWLDNAERSGKLKEMIDGGTRALWNTLRVLGNILQIFGRLGDAAHRALGDDLMGKLADSLDRAEKALGSKNVQKMLTGVFKAAREGMDEISRRSGPALREAFRNLGLLVMEVFPIVGGIIGETIGGIADAFNQPRLRGAVVDFFSSLRGLAEEIRPAFGDIGNAVGAVVDLLATFVKASAPSAGAVLSQIAKIVITLADGLRPLVEELAPAAGELFEAILPGVQKVAEAIAGFTSGAGGQAIAQFIRDLIPLAEKLFDVIGDIATELMQVANEYLPKIRDAMAPIIERVTEWLESNKDGIVSALGSIARFLGDIVVGILELDGALEAILISAAIFKVTQWITGLSVAIGTAEGAGLVGALGRLNPLVAVLGGLAAVAAAIVIVDPQTGILGWINHFIRSAWEIITFPIETLFGWFQNVEDFIQGWTDRLVDHFTSRDGASVWGLILDFLRNEPEGIPDYSGGGRAGGAPGTPPKSNWGGQKPWEVGGASFRQGLDGITNDFNTWSIGFASNWDTHWGQIGTLNGFSEGAVDKLDEKLRRFDGSFTDMYGRVDPQWRDFWGGLPGVFDADLFDGPLSGQLDGMTDRLFGWMPGFGDSFGGFFGKLPELLPLGLGDTFGRLLDGLLQRFGGFAPNFQGHWAGLWDGTIPMTEKSLDKLGHVFGSLRPRLEQGVGEGMSGATQTMQIGWGSMHESTELGVGGVIQLAGGIPMGVRGAVGDLGSTLYIPGQQLMYGLSNGIYSQIKVVEKAARQAAMAATNAARSNLRIASPSRVFEEIGEQTIDGLVRGLERGAKVVSSTMGGIASDMVLSAQPGGFGKVTGRLGAVVNGSLAGGGDQHTSHRTLNYYAAAGNSMSSEEDLFLAAARTRMAW